MKRKYFETRKEALQECERRNRGMRIQYYRVFKMPKGTRNHGKFAVCSEFEYLNTY